jgi:predicted nucleotidyltransferase
MRTGQVEANLIRLNETARLPYLAELIERKTGGPEKGRLERSDFAFHQREYERLSAQLEQARAESNLPEEAEGAERLNELLVQIRMAACSRW